MSYTRRGGSVAPIPKVPYTEAMTKTEVQRQALLLSERERLLLAEELWASVEDPNAVAVDLPLPRWQRELIDERLEASKDDPGKPWKQFKAEIWPERA